MLLKNSDKLTGTQADKLQRLLAENTNMNTLYVLKEQLQALWCSTQVERWLSN
jgi:Transposase